MSEAAEITIKGLSDLAVGTYLLVDVRDAISFGYGAIPGAVSMPDIVEQAEAGKLAKDKKYILYCMKGMNSARLVPKLRELDYDAVEKFKTFLKKGEEKITESTSPEAIREIRQARNINSKTKIKEKNTTSQ